MSKESIKSMKEMLMACTQGQMSNLASADTHELGEAIDMIKDLEEALYYCTITEAMEKQKEEGSESAAEPMRYYTRVLPYDEYDRPIGRNYYRDSRNSPTYSGDNSGSYTGMSYYTMRDDREGRSPVSRRTYMESKELHKDKETTMRELEKYVQELSNDVVDMIKEATPEEKSMLRDKISKLATKIQ